MDDLKSPSPYLMLTLRDFRGENPLQHLTSNPAAPFNRFILSLTTSNVGIADNLGQEILNVSSELKVVVNARDKDIHDGLFTSNFSIITVTL